MKVKRYRLFKIPDEKNNSVIGFIPELFRIYRFNSKGVATIPDYVRSDDSVETNLGKLYVSNIIKGKLIVTNKCNLSCAYCYSNCGPRKTSVMSEEIAYAAIDYLIQKAKQLNVHKVYLSFFGGEPTQAWQLMQNVTTYFDKRIVDAKLQRHIGINTNGVFTIEQARWLAKNLDSITISLDGFKTIHDIQRSGSFDQAFNTAQILYKEQPHKLAIRSTVSDMSVNSLPKIAEFFGNNFPHCVQMYEPLSPIGRGQSCTILKPPDPTLFFTKFLEAARIAAKYDAIVHTSVLQFKPLSDGAFCGANGRNFIIVYDGRVISCHRMDEEIDPVASFFRYGRFNENTSKFVFDYRKKKGLEKKLNAENISDCRNCFAYYFCRGDCPANKAALFPKTFWKEPSDKCKAIQEFAKATLKYFLNYGPQGLIRQE